MTGITLALFSCLALEVDQNNFSVKILIVCRIGLPLPRNMIGLPLPRNMIGLPLSRNMIGLENSCHPLNQSDGTPRIRHTLACVSRAFGSLPVFTLSSCWLFAPVNHCNYLGIFFNDNRVNFALKERFFDPTCTASPVVPS